MSYRTFTAGLMILVLNAPVQAQTTERRPVTIPFEVLKTKHMAVQVKVNGNGPYRLIFDTGAPITVLSTKAAKEAGLITDDTPAPLIPIFGSDGQMRIKAFEIGTLKVGNVEALALDHPAVSVLAKEEGPLEGIVGFPFFSRYKMTLDYQARTMTLTPTDYEPPDLLKNLLATIMSGTRGPRMVAPAAQWGLVVDKDAQDEDAGVAVKEVLIGSAASAAGLRPGDRLLAIEGRWTDSVADCYTVTASIKPGTSATVGVRRDGKEMTLKVTPRNGL